MQELTVDQLPTRPGDLRCAQCGREPTNHTSWGSTPDWTPHSFVRPGLPGGYTYLDQLTEGDHFLLLNDPWYGSEKVLAIRVTGNGSRDGAPLYVVRTEARVVNPPGLHYESGNTIVQVLDQGLPIGQRRNPR